MPKSKYIFQPADDTRCEFCHNIVFLLCREDLKEDKPMFYICFHCKTIAEVGIGPVKLTTL